MCVLGGGGAEEYVWEEGVGEGYSYVGRSVCSALTRVRHRERERGRETETERARDRDRQTDRQTVSQKQNQ